MAMVISQTTKAAIGGFLALMILGAVLVVGAAFGWFDPRREDEDTPAKVSARLQGRTSFVTHRAVSITIYKHKQEMLLDLVTQLNKITGISETKLST